MITLKRPSKQQLLTKLDSEGPGSVGTFHLFLSFCEIYLIYNFLCEPKMHCRTVRFEAYTEVFINYHKTVIKFCSSLDSMVFNFHQIDN